MTLGFCVGGEISGCITSTLPLLYCRGLVTSMGGAFCFGMRRLGGFKSKFHCKVMERMRSLALVPRGWDTSISC
jgi:hypothetical protein